MGATLAIQRNREGLGMVSDEQRQAIGLYRYSLIREPADPGWTPRERGPLVRALAAHAHRGPAGEWVRVSRVTLDRWIHAYRAGGFAALIPAPRRVGPRTPAAVLARAVALRQEVPARTAAQIAAILREADGWSPTARTLERHFARRHLPRGETGPPRVFGRFEATRPNELWTGDALHGPVIGGRKTYLFAFIDDHSRVCTGYRWGVAEDSLRLEAAFRAGLAARGIPSGIFVDNGSPFVSGRLARTCAVLGIRLIHSTPRESASRGKIERFFRTVRGQFLVELTAHPVADLAELNRRFTAWVEAVYHLRGHTETGTAPLTRFLAAGAPTLPTPAQLHEAFLWEERRQVTKTATVSLYGNVFEVDGALVGRRVALIFDPFDLTAIAVRFEGRPMGQAVPVHLGRHVRHPDARSEAAPPPAPTGIDYLGLVTTRYEATTRRRIAYAHLPNTPGPDPPPDTE